MVCSCIDGVYCELHHESAKKKTNLRFLCVVNNIYKTTCSCTYTRQCKAAFGKIG